MSRKCPICGKVFTGANVSGPIVYGEQHVVFDGDTITAVSPIVAHAVLKAGQEFSRKDRIYMSCPECNAHLSVDKFLIVYLCPVTGFDTGLVDMVVYGKPIKLHESIGPEYVQLLSAWVENLAMPLPSAEVDNIAGLLRGIGAGSVR